MKITFDKIDEITENIDEGRICEPLVEPTEEDLLELTKTKKSFEKYLPYLISISTVYENRDIVMVINDIIDRYVEE